MARISDTGADGRGRGQMVEQMVEQRGVLPVHFGGDCPRHLCRHQQGERHQQQSKREQGVRRQRKDSRGDDKASGSSVRESGMRENMVGGSREAAASEPMEHMCFHCLK